MPKSNKPGIILAATAAAIFSTGAFALNANAETQTSVDTETVLAETHDKDGKAHCANKDKCKAKDKNSCKAKDKNSCKAKDKNSCKAKDKNSCKAKDKNS